MSVPNTEPKTGENGPEEGAETEVDGQEEQQVEETEGTEEEGTESETEEESEESEDEGGDELPEWAREKLTKANAEAANYRVRAREAEEKLKNAKSLEEVDAIVAEMTKDREATEHALLRENVALKFKLPEAAQKRLAGTTREELEADAKELADLFGTEVEDDERELEGGLRPRNTDPDAGLGPRELAGRYGRGRKR